MTTIKMSQLIGGALVLYSVGFGIGLWVGFGVSQDDAALQLRHENLDLRRENEELDLAVDRLRRDQVAEMDAKVKEWTLPPQSVVTDTE